MFYKKSWIIVGELICLAVQEFQQSRKFLTQINSTSMCLLHKCVNASRVTDFRPTSCCNVIYKILTKVLANMIRLMLPRVVDYCQRAFITRRDMSQNIF